MSKRGVVLLLTLVLGLTVRAQDQERVDKILFYVNKRTTTEADASFDQGDYPRVIQLLKMEYEVRPWDGELATNLIWMLGNIEDDGAALAYAIRYRQDNPNDPDHGLPEATLYWGWRAFARIPAILEPDIDKDWDMHRNVFVLLSNAYDRMGFHKDVVRVLDIALKHYPGDEVFQRNRQKSLGLIGG